MRRSIFTLAALACAAPAWAADELPQGPKAPPPEPLPEAICDTSIASTGEWLLGRWVAPYAKWQFQASPAGLTFAFEQKPDINRALGWKDGATFDGKVAAVSPCSLKLVAGDNGEAAFVFEGVRTEDGKIYGFATNKGGQRARWVLRRER
ncbi:conserved exported hypothetical protein [Candidatus Terasakiella magnetica]|nr:conserved exported hypothetical protein [Candidatus Terasakiella magnetica]